METETLNQSTEFLGKRDPLSQYEGETIEEKPTKINGDGKENGKNITNDQAEELKKVIKTYRIVDGVAPVDEFVQNRDNYRVCQLFGKTFSKVLNQSNVAANTNKFYILQMLENIHSKDVFVFFRWGRLGVKGTDCLMPFGRDTGAAIAEFEAKFKEKAEDGNYEEIDISFEDELNAEEQEEQMIKAFQKASIPSAVATLIKDIFSLKLFEAQIKEVGFDSKKLPLGKLSSANLKMGYNLLKMISKELEQNGPASKAKLESFSNKFYTFIPHNVGFKKMEEFTIKSPEMVQKKMELLDSLSQMKIAREMIDTEARENSNNKIDEYYKQLKNKIEVLNPDSDKFKQIKKYFESSQSAEHNAKMEISEIYKLERESEDSKFNKDIGNRKLLWTGSKLSNYAGILNQGLKGAPLEAPASGYILGKGIYFTDASSKCALNLNWQQTGNTGLMLLCDVALGNQHKLKRPSPTASQLPEGTHSVLGVGMHGPQKLNESPTKEGYVIPNGPIKATNERDTMFTFNEYVVYNPSQVRMRYLVKCKFN